MNYSIEDLDNKWTELQENLVKIFSTEGIKVNIWCSGDNTHYRNKSNELKNSIYYVCLDVVVFYDENGIAIKPRYDNIDKQNPLFYSSWIPFDEQIQINKGPKHSSGKSRKGGRILFNVFPDGVIKQYDFNYDPIDETYLIDAVEKIVRETYEHPRLRINKRNDIIKSELLAKIWCPSAKLTVWS